jgi:hypothetical protein
MSLDMTIGTRSVDALSATHAGEAEFEVEVTPAERAWVQNVVVGAAAFFGVAVSSALGVLLFLR